MLTNPDGYFTSTSNYGKYFYFRGYNTANISATELSHLQINLTKSKNDACESAGAYWAWMHANKFADVQTQNTYRAITLDHTSQLLKGRILTIYENISFRKIACAINLPAAVERADPRMNGLADRYSAYAVAQLVLMDTAGFPDAKGSVSFTTPTFNSRERS